MTLQFMLVCGLAALALAWLVRGILQACRKDGCSACSCKGCPARRKGVTVRVRRREVPGCR